MLRSGVTFVATDIEGSTAHNVRLGDLRWIERLLAHNDIVREQVARHGGRELKFLGDGFLLVFEDACSAVACAKDVQGAMAARAHGVRVRVAVHSGQAWLTDDDALGLDVTTTYRLLDRARGGEILLSAATQRRRCPGRRAHVRRRRRIRAKGLGRKTAFSVAWQPLPDAT